MRNKAVVSTNLERIKNNIKSIRYLVNSGGSFQDIHQAFETLDENVDKVENLINIEPDSFLSSNPT